MLIPKEDLHIIYAKSIVPVNKDRKLLDIKRFDYIVKFLCAVGTVELLQIEWTMGDMCINEVCTFVRLYFAMVQW